MHGIIVMIVINEFHYHEDFYYRTIINHNIKMIGMATYGKCVAIAIYRLLFECMWFYMY